MENSRIKALAGMLTEKKWSGDVSTKWKPAEGFFTKSADAIVKGLLAAPGGRKKAMSRLNFYINRGGKNLSADDKARLERAKAKLQAMKEEADLYAHRAGIILEKKKHDDADEDPDMDMDDSAPKEKGEEEEEETLPAIVKKIAKKAEGKTAEELEELLMKVYEAGHKDGEKEAKEEMEGGKGKKDKDDKDEKVEEAKKVEKEDDKKDDELEHLKDVKKAVKDSKLTTKMLAKHFESADKHEAPYEGRQYGTTDSAPPQDHSVDELSRVADLLHAAHHVGGTDLQHKVFGHLPDSKKLEFNYANWKYKKKK